MKKIKEHCKALVIIILPLVLGFSMARLSPDTREVYDMLVHPPLSPPGVVFPIMWAILYLFMGIAAFLVYKAKVLPEYKKSALKFYWGQLFINVFWSIFFFTLGWMFFAFIWLLLLAGLIVVTMKKFKPISKTSYYLLLPYLLWVGFAGYLNFAFSWLN